MWPDSRGRNSYAGRLKHRHPIDKESTMFTKHLLKMSSICLTAIGVLAACDDSALSPSVQQQTPMFTKGGNGGGGGGKPGGGSDGPFPATATILATANLVDDGSGPYVDGECGVQADVGSTIAYLKPAATNIRRKDRAACGDGRSGTVNLTMQHLSDDPADHSQDVAISETYDLISLKPRLDDGPLARMTINTSRCETGLEFDDVEYGGANRVLVAANADNTSWAIDSQAHPDNVVGCSVGSAVEYFHMDVSVEFAKN
jgi:hypothetical protein